MRKTRDQTSTASSRTTIDFELIVTDGRIGERAPHPRVDPLDYTSPFGRENPTARKTASRVAALANQDLDAQHGVGLPSARLPTVGIAERLGGASGTRKQRALYDRAQLQSESKTAVACDECEVKDDLALASQVPVFVARWVSIPPRGIVGGCEPGHMLLEERMPCRRQPVRIVQNACEHADLATLGSRETQRGPAIWTETTLNPRR